MAVACFVFAVLRRYCISCLQPWLFACLVVLAECGAGFPFWPFFPWSMSGYAWAGNVYLLQVAALVGIIGMSILVVATGVCFANYKQAKLAIGVIILCMLGGWWRIEHAAPIGMDNSITMRIVQLNHTQEQSRTPSGSMQIFNEYLELSRYPDNRDKVGIIFWPEGSARFVLNEQPGMQEKLTQLPQEVIFGGLWSEQEADGATHYFNVALQKKKGDRAINSFVKKKMVVPISEHIPFSAYLQESFKTAMPSFAGITHRAPQETAYLSTELGKALLLNCYEAIFSRVILRYAANADYLLHLSNDAWVGKSIGRDQFLAIVRTRAVEANRPLIRSANKGYDAVIDGYGRIMELRNQPDFPEVWDVTMPVLLHNQADSTPYVQMGQFVLGNIKDTKN
jgi:apolipoprotein N-acyltransferase